MRRLASALRSGPCLSASAQTRGQLVTHALDERTWTSGDPQSALTLANGISDKWLGRWA